MINWQARFAIVRNPHIDLSVSERIVFADLQTSRVDKRKIVDGKPAYIRSVWFNVAFVGDAFEPAKALHGGEYIDVLRASQTYEKDKNGKYFLNMTVYEFDLSERSSCG